MNRTLVKVMRLTGLFFGLLLIALIGIMIWFTKATAHGLITNPRDVRHVTTATPADMGITAPYVDLMLTAADGAKIAATYIESRNGAAVILVHGFKGSHEEMLNEAAMLAKHGYGAIMIDLRAHGVSDGEQITFGLHEVQDVDAAYQYLLTRPDVDPERIGIIGNSMGANITILYAADNPQLKAVVANSSFASMQDEAAYGIRAMTGLPPFPFAPLIQFWAEQETGFKASQISAEERIDEISPRPVFLMQGGMDDIVPPDNGQQLYDAAREPKELWYDESLGHTQFDTVYPEEYERRVIALFDAYLLGQP